MFFGALFSSMAMPVPAIDETCENGLCMQEDTPALSLLQTKAQKMTAVEYSDLGTGKCLYQPPTPVLAAVDPPKFGYKSQEGRNCEALCTADEKCGGYSNDKFNNCLLWLEPSANLVQGGKPWGDCDCHVKDTTGYKNVGSGKCLYQPEAPKPKAVDPKYKYESQKGRQCRELCDTDQECQGYSNDDVNNCLLWTEGPLVGGGRNWGNCKCYVKK